MACGKPPDPSRTSSPRPLAHPAAQPALRAIRHAEDLVARVASGKEVDDAINWISRLVANASATGLTPEQVASLQGKLDELRGFAQSRLRDNVTSPGMIREKGTAGASAKWVMRHFSEAAAARNVGVVARALKDPTHWQARAYKDQLMRLVAGNSRIPDDYKAQLPRDVATILQVAPNAAGIVKAMTLRGQHSPLASRSKLGSDGNAAIGSAYEIMGTAALIRSPSASVNGGLKLYIDGATDKVSFGSKANINRQACRAGLIEMPTRRTVECDVQIGRKTLFGYREIGIDFKHSKYGSSRSASDDLRNQVENVARAIRHGQLHEYHFVTNTCFAESFKAVVTKVNKTLVADGFEAIACHEHVTSIPPSILPGVP